MKRTVQGGVHKLNLYLTNLLVVDRSRCEMKGPVVVGKAYVKERRKKNLQGRQGQRGTLLKLQFLKVGTQIKRKNLIYLVSRTRSLKRQSLKVLSELACHENAIKKGSLVVVIV